MNAENVNSHSPQSRRDSAQDHDPVAAAIQRAASASTRQVAPASALGPRDIQERIRKGASVEELAEITGTPVAKLMPFAGPALDEREYHAARAQKALLHGSTSAAATLGTAVAAHFKTFYEDPEIIVWDSYRRPDGRWQVSASYTTEPRAGTAVFVYDIPGNFVFADNDDALWLTGEAVAPKPQATVLPALEVIRNEEPTEVVVVETVEVVTVVVEEPVAVEPPALTPPTAAPRKRKRPSVPAWDQIMFGA